MPQNHGAGSRLMASTSRMPVGNANPIRKPAGINTASDTAMRTGKALDVIASNIGGQDRTAP